MLLGSQPAHYNQLVSLPGNPGKPGVPGGPYAPGTMQGKVIPKTKKHGGCTQPLSERRSEKEHLVSDVFYRTYHKWP